MHGDGVARLGRHQFVIVVLAACIAASGAGPSRASAASSIESFAATTSTLQAGTHPDLGVDFSLRTGAGADTAQSALFSLPAGITLEPALVPHCTGAQFTLTECPPASQVGLVTIRAAYEGEPDFLLGTGPVYALQAQAGEFGRIAFTIATIDVPVVGQLSLREASDYGLRIDFEGLPQSTPLAGMRLSIWGVPAGSSHDADRFAPGSSGAPPGCPGLEDTSCATSVASPELPLPFTLNPSLCGGPLAASLAVRSYQEPGAVTLSEAAYPATSGCSITAFEPAMSAQPTTAAGYSPSGLIVQFGIQQTQESEAIAPSEARIAAITLPEGFWINPNLPENLSACTDAEAALGTEEPSACPEEAQLGTASLELANLAAPIAGKIFLGVAPEESEEARLLLIATGEGVEFKLIGTLGEDPQTGQLTIAFDDLPQLPIEGIGLHFLGAQRSIFRTPLRCGTYPIDGTLVPWNGEGAVGVTSAFPIDSGPGGAPCVGAAQTIALTLVPETIAADGASSTMARIEVTDANGSGIPEDDVSLSSSDPGEHIGPVIDNEDGTYSARITSSTTPGTATVTASDLSVSPTLSGSALLTQAALTAPQPIAPAGSPAAAPVVTFVRKPPRKSAVRRPRFGFQVDSPGASFSCRLDGAPFHPCKSPVVLPKLAFGPHAFAVRADNGALTGKAAIWHFRIVHRPRGRHHHAKRFRR